MKPRTKDEETFDTIVTGAGSAGAVVAARLSEDPVRRVLLLEAGRADRNPWIRIPLGYAKLFADPAVNWMFESEPEPELHNRPMYQPRGKVLGGTSSINGMIYMRGNHADYDDWRQRGCEGWDWESVLPYFRKAEDQERGANEFHGVGGALRVSNQPQRWELADAILQACLQAGIQAMMISMAPDRRGGLLPDHNQKSSALEHGVRLSASGSGAAEPDHPYRGPCHSRADRERSRGRRRVPHAGWAADGAGARRGGCCRWRVRLTAASATLRSRGPASCCSK